MIVVPRKSVCTTAQCYGNEFGMSVKVCLPLGQKWEAHKKCGYWWLTRKGFTLELRLTEAALKRLFEEERR